MNIFILDYDLEKCAQYHNNRHLVKMITEQVQILSTVCRLSGLDIGYKITHKNHPCVKWVMESRKNFFWLYCLTIQLQKEWRLRFNHPNHIHHGAVKVLYGLPVTILSLPDKELTPFALAMPDYCKTDDPVESYRNYYMKEKRHLADWGNRGTPYWYK